MHRQAVKDRHISCIDLPADPIASLGCFPVDVSLGVLKPKKMRPFHDLDRSLSLQAIVHRHPESVAFGASCNSRVVLMRMQKGARVVGENHPCNRLGMDQKARPYKPLHHTGQYRMVRQRVEPLQSERAICGLLIFRIRIVARHGGIREALRWSGRLYYTTLARSNTHSMSAY